MSDNVDKLTIPEIEEILNSKKFITSIKRKALEAKLEHLRVTETEKFPTLSKNVVTNIDVSDNIQNFSIIAKKEIVPQNDNVITVDYDDIKKLYYKFAVYRIKLYHVTLKNKIFLLNSITYAKNPYAKIFKTHFDYNKLVYNESIINKCINVCSGLEYIIDTMNYFRNMIENTIRLNEENKKIISIKYIKISELNNIANTMESQYVEQFNVIYNKILLLKSYQESSSGESHKILIEELIDFIEENCNLLQNFLINEFDPHIKCEYLVELDCSGKIIMSGTYNNYYVDCNDVIDSHHEYDNLKPKILQTILLNDLICMFNNKYNIAEYTNFFSIKVNEYDFYVRYNVVDILSKIQRGTLEIKNYIGLPYIASTWSKVYDSMNKYPGIPFQDGVKTPQLVNNMISKNYKHEYRSPEVKYLFDELNNEYPGIIKENMFDSFCNLAYRTSRI